MTLIIEVHSGAGGTESCDWARMLLRMYARWGERHKFKVEVIEETSGDEAGIKSATLLIKGHNAHGWAKTESGVHRLVRISPFDSNARRHTSFASVWVYPVIDDRIDIRSTKAIAASTPIAPRAPAASTSTRPIRRSASPIFRQASSSPARRSVRSTRTAPPPGTCCARASTSRNWNAARPRPARSTPPRSEIGWGHQIRSYVLQPYQMVKDLRTGVISGTPDEVLDGDIDAFMEAALAQRVHGGGPDKVDDVD